MPAMSRPDPARPDRVSSPSLPRRRDQTDALPLVHNCSSKTPPAAHTRRSAMDGQGGGGWLPLDLSLATAGDLSLATAGPSASASAGERRPRPRPNRRTVSSLYAELGAMLPNLPTDRAASKEEIVDAAAERVKMLEDTVAVLETYRAVRSPAAAAAGRRQPEVSVAVGAVCFCARLPARSPGALARALEAFHRRGVEVLVATVGRHGHGQGAAVLTVTAAAAPPEVLEMIRADIAAIY
ncbi:uncharacterized protein LOC8065952 [Sorghum bicolor]|uniref:BHLH domain-containing protein n=1 Tax=Sorghum bicolor TaxID=4558 RepID=A0A1B6PE79_SORBI|nr:uncharacterized protein LOC8065952 [Sorghum bicolor]KXG23976.2 hypothetical protein SORBI_3008G116800 [Sorghum bicolor]|eukprot:XP_002443294.2 uncharacterized protein LOC8065952 [Sorghum bicolor]